MNSWIVLTCVLIPIAIVMKGDSDCNTPTEDKIVKQLDDLNKTMNRINRRN